MLFGYMEDRKIITGIITNPGTNQSISRRDIENISGMALIMCEGIVSDIVGTAEEIEIEEES